MELTMTESHRLDLAQLSREELFSKVWTSPILKVAEAFGISDVALKKRCRKLNIPTPNRGYWARIEAGQHIKRPKLPKESTPAHLRPDSVGKQAWPEGRRGWCQRARDFESALIKKGVGYRGLIQLKDPLFPEAHMLPDRIFDAARIFHALLVIAEPAGYLFKPYRGTYESGFFLNGRDPIRIVIQDADHHRISQY